MPSTNQININKVNFNLKQKEVASFETTSLVCINILCAFNVGDQDQTLQHGDQSGGQIL
jgi:hypothetical protein